MNPRGRLAFLLHGALAPRPLTMHSRHLASRIQIGTQRACLRRQTRLGSSSATAVALPNAVCQPAYPITQPSRTNDSKRLKDALDKPYTSSSSSSLLAPTGLLGIPDLRVPSDFVTLADETVHKAQALVMRISKAPAAGLGAMRNVVLLLDRLSETLCAVIDAAELLRHAHPDPKWVSAANTAYEMLCSYMNTLNVSTELHQVLNTVMSDSSIYRHFSEEEHAVASIFLRDFERSGVKLPDSQRSQFVSISDEILALGRAFVTNGPGRRGHVDIPITQLRNTVVADGRPLMDSLRHRVSRITGKVRIDGNSWEAHMILKYCTDPGIRKQVYLESHKPDRRNVENLEGLLKARARLAKLVGFESFAEMTLGDKMAKTSENVRCFLNALGRHHRPSALAEIAELARLKNGDDRSKDPVVQAWDREFCSIQLPRDSVQSLKNRLPSLSVGTVFQGLSDLFRRTFGLQLGLVEANPGETWHPDVRKLEVIDEDAGVQGWIFADLFSRPGKPGGAAHYTVRCSRRLDLDDWEGDRAFLESSVAATSPYRGPSMDGISGKGAGNMGPRKVKGKEGVYQLPIAVLSCEFTKPTITDGPTKLPWHEIETLFHEMGHALHSMVGQTEFHNVSGTRCATDFVELPSILMEHFLASSSVRAMLLDRPESSFDERVISSRQQSRSKALDAHAQILYSILDQSYHSELPLSASFSSTATLKDLQNTLGVIPHVDGTAWQSQFTHLYGYGATYYAYVFDQALASRVWDRIFARDPFDREQGEKYKTDVLKWGGGRDPWRMLGLLLEDEEIIPGDQRAMEKVGQWGIEGSVTKH